MTLIARTCCACTLQYGNYIGPAGAEVLAKALGQMTRMEKLELVSGGSLRLLAKDGMLVQPVC